MLYVQLFTLYQYKLLSHMFICLDHIQGEVYLIISFL